jgi:hypothetical protein
MSHDSSGISREEADAILNSDDADAICELLAVLSMNPADSWVKEHYERLTTHQDSQVRRVASICLGYAFG